MSFDIGLQSPCPTVDAELTFLVVAAIRMIVIMKSMIIDDQYDHDYYDDPMTCGGAVFDVFPPISCSMISLPLPSAFVTLFGVVSLWTTFGAPATPGNPPPENHPRAVTGGGLRDARGAGGGFEVIICIRRYIPFTPSEAVRFGGSAFATLCDCGIPLLVSVIICVCRCVRAHV